MFFSLIFLSLLVCLWLRIVWLGSIVLFLLMDRFLYNFIFMILLLLLFLIIMNFQFFVFSMQTGSGKTYTMWGPPNALAVEYSSIDQQGGLAPRVFERLFARINEVSINFKFLFLVESFEDSMDFAVISINRCVSCIGAN